MYRNSITASITLCLSRLAYGAAGRALFGERRGHLHSAARRTRNHFGDSGGRLGNRPPIWTRDLPTGFATRGTAATTATGTATAATTTKAAATAAAALGLGTRLIDIE